MAHEGKHPYNAETTIDYKTKEVKFNYPQEINRKNTWEAYANHLFAKAAAVFLTWPLVIFFVPFLIASIHMLGDKGYGAYFLVIWSSITLIALVYTIAKISVLAVGGISIILHESIPWLRKNYPRSNAAHHVFYRWVKKKLNIKKEVDFSKLPNKSVILREKFIIVNNLLIMKYNIVLSEYELTGECSKKIKRIHTKCIEENKKKRNNPGVSNFRIVFEFEERPKSGKVVIL